MTSRSMLTVLLPHSVYMVHSWMTHGLYGRMHSKSVVVAWTTCNSINRVAIYQELLVEFSCDLHNNILLRDLLLVLLLVFVTSGCHNNMGQHISPLIALPVFFYLLATLSLLCLSQCYSCFFYIFCYKLHSACISTTSGSIFTN